MIDKRKASPEASPKVIYRNHFTPCSKIEQPKPVAPVLRVRGDCVFVECPFCGQPHMHGNPLPGETRSRVPHCPPEHRQRGLEYVIGEVAK